MQVTAYARLTGDQAGQPIGDVKNAFRSAVEDAGIEDFRFHDMRHRLVLAGDPGSRHLNHQGIDGTPVDLPDDALSASVAGSQGAQVAVLDQGPPVSGNGSN